MMLGLEVVKFLERRLWWIKTSVF